MTILECVDVWKSFHLHGGASLLGERFKRVFSRRERHAFTALKGISFSVRDGESVGIMGRNGAGKSTLLSLISGLAKPDRGRVIVTGRIAPLLELGSGFHPDLTGRENLLLNAALMGFSEKEIRGKQDEIIDFAGISEFIEEPLRTYSSGMRLRLAFSIAVTVEPEILIVDEVLAVGDQSFTQKCMRRILEMRSHGRTFICVSHSPAMLQLLCDRGLWLDAGQLILEGPIAEVMAAYKGGLVPASTPL